jgi:hypothetical protein
MSEKQIIKILFSAYKFYLHFFALYIIKHEITAEDWILHKKFESKLYNFVPEGYKL